MMTVIGALGAALIAKGVTVGADAITGLVQKHKANKLEKEADKYSPASEDPRMVALLDDIKRKSKTFETASDPLSKELNKDIASDLATTTSALTEGVKGDSGALVSGLTKLQKGAAENRAKVSSLASNKAPQYTSAAIGLADKISQRKFDLKMYDKVSRLQKAAEAEQAANINFGQAIGEGAGALSTFALGKLNKEE